MLTSGKLRSPSATWHRISCSGWLKQTRDDIPPHQAHSLANFVVTLSSFSPPVQNQWRTLVRGKCISRLSRRLRHSSLEQRRPARVHFKVLVFSFVILKLQVRAMHMPCTEDTRIHLIQVAFCDRLQMRVRRGAIVSFPACPMLVHHCCLEPVAIPLCCTWSNRRFPFDDLSSANRCELFYHSAVSIRPFPIEQRVWEWRFSHYVIVGLGTLASSHASGIVFSHHHTQPGTSCWWPLRTAD